MPDSPARSRPAASPAAPAGHGRRRAPLPQPRQPAWSAALAPSQRRAAEARAAAARRRSAEAWLRALGR